MPTTAITTPVADMSNIELVCAAATAARGGPRPQGGSWVLGRLGDSLAELLEQVAENYDTDRDDSPECPNCCAGSIPCGPHPPIDFHSVCGGPVDQCTCLDPAVRVARALLSQP
ncbi:hypothetical protein [Micromonospora chokoriensis]|uniref:hypothetical protein n=1 Tax=Micromonospora chokoriensis TaxID=356851 RepID=UPI0004C3F3E7|nr:hypothetical protein [Micromonospora chokoriensis]